MKEEYKIYHNFPSVWLGAWESVNGNPDMYIFQGYGGNCYLLIYSYDKESERGSFSCYDINLDKDGWYIQMGIRCSRLTPEESPFGLRIAGWGSYMKC
ncbi:DUF3876 domain-containing protein [Dysgonomonas sp. ZJ279]|uniref:DUF3876 domain-containing protein n=1 Tax=Dysgonomonas sp. ZJ279 TaxID=2709796 RepID=UPI0013EB9EC4|nr:DUF3876 domain-containing protein [Dysgonomonas sp. ZJ279]